MTIKASKLANVCGNIVLQGSEAEYGQAVQVFEHCRRLRVLAAIRDWRRTNWAFPVGSFTGCWKK
nr:hypothetical protein [Propionispora hippei]